MADEYNFARNPLMTALFKDFYPKSVRMIKGSQLKPIRLPFLYCKIRFRRVNETPAPPHHPTLKSQTQNLLSWRHYSAYNIYRSVISRSHNSPILLHGATEERIFNFVFCQKKEFTFRSTWNDTATKQYYSAAIDYV